MAEPTDVPDAEAQKQPRKRQQLQEIGSIELGVVPAEDAVVNRQLIQPTFRFMLARNIFTTPSSSASTNRAGQLNQWFRSTMCDCRVKATVIQDRVKFESATSTCPHPEVAADTKIQGFTIDQWKVLANCALFGLIRLCFPFHSK